ncbi:hypothetical protein SAMN04489761_1811 [Tenacibaculum sp. MAR_2009_124]|uniref:SRPBCC domain-containing protein n=1 Tax=Tenacibaculum sp. MAR_2009_124 TaxID=1250059 RepID=UPI000898A8E7|nr:SRPBCC domain-containing protein [Tenacibaculum sp. MAR_2009_124]SEB80172.1 hypothetical protein SAMN04489761_1811 [Tenacibaculum sp. MAR_2009_124]
MTKNITTQIIINTPPEKVWNTLVNTDSYSLWNPFIKKIEGVFKIGNTITVTIQKNKSSKMVFKPIILNYVKNELLIWKGKLLFKGIFDGEHFFKLIDNNNGTCTFIHGEIFSGFLIKYFDLSNTKQGFELMNNALKVYCEQKA